MLKYKKVVKKDGQEAEKRLEEEKVTRGQMKNI